MPEPGEKPLNFIRSVPRNGAVNVSPSRKTMLLVFDKNVVNDSVWDNNRNQIRLFRGKIRVSIRVKRIPDTVDFSKRRNIYVTPVRRLRSLASYRLVVLPNLRSKAGETLGKTVTIRFKNGSMAPEE
jgi:hypothetical protein